MNTLVLDIGYQPIGVIPWTKALSLISRGSAVPLQAYSDIVYTNEMDISVYDPDKFGPLGKFFDEELVSDERVRVTLERPAVIRALYKAIWKKDTHFSRQNVYLRDGYRCQYEGCKTTAKHLKRNGTDVLPSSVLTFDHVIPRSRGGKTSWQNIVTCCSPCNSIKDNRTPAEAKMVLKKKPKEPRGVPVVGWKVNSPDEWRDWLYWNAELDS